VGQRTIKANELRDVNVKLISLVKRGANRLPIRVMKGDTAVLDLGSYFIRKSDDDTGEMMKREAKKKSDLQAAIGLLQQNGFGVIKLETAKSEPADDGVGRDEGKNPADGSDAGGPRDDGTSGTDDHGDSLDGADADAGGLRDNGTDGSKAPLTNDYVPVNKAEKEAVAAALAAIRKGEATPVKKGSKKKPAAASIAADASATQADPVQCADASDDPNPNEMAGGDGEDGEGSDPDADDDSVQEVTHQKGDKKGMKKSETPDIATIIQAAFKKHEDALTGFVREQIGGLQSQIKEIDQRVQKSEEASSTVAKRLTGIVPAQAPGEGSGAVRKTDNFLPPPLDTGYTNGRR
jgi:hypothetical protein